MRSVLLALALDFGIGGTDSDEKRQELQDGQNGADREFLLAINFLSRGQPTTPISFCAKISTG